MKKIMTLAAIFAAVAMTFSACEQTEQPDNGGENTENTGGENNGGENTGGENNGGENTGGENNGGENTEYESPISIDGDFADWDALDASKVAVATCADNAMLTAMKTLKVYVDEHYLNVYVEFNEDDLTMLDWVPLNLYINADNSENTAVKDWIGQGGQDYMFEGAYYSVDTAIPYDPSLSGYTGTEDAPGWNWDDEILPQETGIGTGAGNLTAYEFALDLQMLAEEYDFVLADTFGLGLTVSQNWVIAGLLPNADPTETNAKGCAPFLEVTIDK